MSVIQISTENVFRRGGALYWARMSIMGYKDWKKVICLIDCSQNKIKLSRSGSKRRSSRRNKSKDKPYPTKSDGRYE